MREGWEIKKLRDMAISIVDGSHNPPKGINQGKYLMLSSKNVYDGYLTIENPRLLSQEDFEEEHKRTHVNKGDVLLTIVGTIGRCCVYDLDYPVCFQRSVAVISPASGLDSYFLMYAMRQIKGYLTDSAQGAAQKGIYLKQLGNISIPVPSLSEQQRIVEILDREFERIDALKANAEQALQAAKDLFQASIYNELTKVSATQIKLKDACIIRPSKKETIGGLKSTDTVSFLPMEDLQIENYYIQPTKQKSLKEVDRNSYTCFANGDVIMAKVTPCFENGKIGIADGLANGIGFGSSEYIVFRPKQGLNKEYLYFCLMNPVFRGEGKKQMLGACGLKRLSKDFVDNTLIPLPTVDVQHKIAERLLSMSATCKQIQSNSEQIIARCEALKQSLLRQAFNGEL